MVVVRLVWYGFLGWFTVFFYLNGGGSLCFARFMVVGLGGFFYFFYFFLRWCWCMWVCACSGCRCCCGSSCCDSGGCAVVDDDREELIYYFNV